MHHWGLQYLEHEGQISNIAGYIIYVASESQKLAKASKELRKADVGSDILLKAGRVVKAFLDPTILWLRHLKLSLNLNTEERQRIWNPVVISVFLIKLVWAAMNAGPLAWAGPIEPDEESVNISRNQFGEELIAHGVRSW